jgi:HSP20 family protein
MLPAKRNIVSNLTNFGREFDNFSRLVDDIFHFHGLPTITGVDKPLFSPDLDLSETDKDYIISLEVPGCEQSSLDISVDDNSTLIIKGEKKYTQKEEKEQMIVNECYYGSFRREIPLPSNANADNISATSKNGILSITLPKKAEEKLKIRKIDVKSIE